MSAYDRFLTDKKFEVDGVCFEEPTFRYWLGRTGGANKQFQKLFEKLSRRHRRQIQTDTLPEDVGQQILWQCYARAVVKRWEVLVDGEWVEGFETLDGEFIPGPVRESDLIELFEKVPEFFAGIMSDSTNLQYYLIEQAETDAKNS